MRPSPSNLLDFQRSTAPCATKPPLERCASIPESELGRMESQRAARGAADTRGDSNKPGTEPGSDRSLRHPSLSSSRSYAPPVPTARDHYDDYRAELGHGRIGRAAADRRERRNDSFPLPLALACIFLLCLGGGALMAGWLGALLVGCYYGLMVVIVAVVGGAR